MDAQRIEEQEINERPALPGRNAPESEVKHAAALLLNEHGMGPAAIAKVTGYHEKHVARLLPKLRKESLRAPRKLKLASKCVESIMAGYLGDVQRDENGQVVKDEHGKPVIQYDPRVKASDAKGVAELVYKAHGEIDGDRQPSGPGQSFTQITINSAYFGTVIEGQQTQDVVLPANLNAQK